MLDSSPEALSTGMQPTYSWSLGVTQAWDMGNTVHLLLMNFPINSSLYLHHEALVGRALLHNDGQ